MTEQDWTDGMPQGIDAWFRKQGDWFTIIHSAEYGTIFSWGPATYVLYETMSKYLKKGDEDGWGVELNIDKIREDFCTPVEDITVSDFVSHKTRKLWQGIHAWVSYLLGNCDELDDRDDLP